MGPSEKKELITRYSLLAPVTRLFGKYNGAVTVSRAMWLEERGHGDKNQVMVLFDLLRLKLGALNPSHFPISDYLEVYRKQLEELLSLFDMEYPEHLTWWITPYTFDVQCEQGRIQTDDYSGDFTEWCFRHLQSRLV
jgi:hypothetical protein